MAGRDTLARAPFDPQHYLEVELGKRWRTCGGSPHTGKVALETTLHEIVDVNFSWQSHDPVRVRTCMVRAACLGPRAPGALRRALGRVEYGAVGRGATANASGAHRRRAGPIRVVNFAAVDVRDGEALAEALEGADVMIVAINASVYDAQVWAELRPPMHRGLIAATRETGIRVVLLDALYQYALNRGPLSPETPQLPATKKGEVRKSLVQLWDASGVRPAHT